MSDEKVSCLDVAAADNGRAGGSEGSITVYPNGPLLVRGGVRITTPDGTPIPNDRQTVALCRCGKSAIKPWCDGTHKITKFTAPTPSS